MRSLRFHTYGNALDVLHLEEADIPEPGPLQIRVAVEACGLTPADWALCNGLFAGDLPRGIGLEVSGVVTAIGADVDGVRIGDAVFGPAPYTGASAGASDEALLDAWAARPAGLSATDAAALPMAVETAYRALDELGVGAGFTGTVLIHGAGSTIGFAAVQIALEHGAQVIATAGSTYAAALEELGARVTSYGDGMADRVRDLADGPVAFAFDAAPLGGGRIEDLVAITGDAEQVLTISDFEAAQRTGARVSFGTDTTQRNDVLGHYGELAAADRFRVPIAQTLTLEHWREAAEVSISGNARGKLILEVRNTLR